MEHVAEVEKLRNDLSVLQNQLRETQEQLGAHKAVSVELQNEKEQEKQSNRRLISALKRASARIEVRASYEQHLSISVQ